MIARLRLRFGIAVFGLVIKLLKGTLPGLFLKDRDGYYQMEDIIEEMEAEREDMRKKLWKLS